MNSRGFTLVEVLLAMAILLIAILGVAVLLPTALRQSTRAAQLTAATLEAESIVSRARRFGRADLRGFPPQDLVTLDSAAEIYSTYRKPVVELLYQIDAASDLYSTLRIEVELPDGGKQTFVTYVANL